MNFAPGFRTAAGIYLSPYLADMEEMSTYNGYRPDFLGPGLTVPLPRLLRQLRTEVAPVTGTGDNVLRYRNFSLVQHARRRFPLFTAANIDGRLFRRVDRHDRWRLDPRLPADMQWGPELYAAEKSDFDRGHMTKREDVQWGHTDEEALAGAMSTFFYTNAVPQVARLNQQLWRSLEDYILKSETVTHAQRIALFTGPVLSEEDPVFVTEVDGREVQLPSLFWKVIYFAKDDGQLTRVGFLMGQEELLERNGLIHPRIISRDARRTPAEQLFMDFKDADTFQVNIRSISRLTRMIFPFAREPYRDDRPSALIRQEVQARGTDGPGYIIEGLQL